MTKWNGMNAVKVDLAKCGICEECGRRFTDKDCQHGTPEQIAYTVELDAQVEAEYEQKRQAREIAKQSQWLDAPAILEKFENPCPACSARHGCKSFCQVAKQYQRDTWRVVLLLGGLMGQGQTRTIILWLLAPRQMYCLFIRLEPCKCAFLFASPPLRIFRMLRNFHCATLLRRTGFLKELAGWKFSIRVLPCGDYCISQI